MAKPDTRSGPDLRLEGLELAKRLPGRRPAGSARPGPRRRARPASRGRWNAARTRPTGWRARPSSPPPPPRAPPPRARPGTCVGPASSRRAPPRARRCPAAARQASAAAAPPLSDAQPDRLRGEPSEVVSVRPGDRRDRGQRLAAEAEVATRSRSSSEAIFEVACRSRRAGRPPRTSRSRRRARGCAPRRRRRSRCRAGGAGVERVLDELLDDRGGPLDDLAGGDAVDDLLESRRTLAIGASLSARPAPRLRGRED